jgi:hypothetical protein
LQNPDVRSALAVLCKRSSAALKSPQLQRLLVFYTTRGERQLSAQVAVRSCIRKR